MSLLFNCSGLYPLTFAIFMNRFVFHCYNALYKQIYIVINNNNNNNKTIKAEQSKRRRGEREGKETYLDMRRIEPLLNSPGFNALFYTPCPGVHQRSQLSPIRSIMNKNRSIFGIGLLHMG